MGTLVDEFTEIDPGLGGTSFLMGSLLLIIFYTE